MGMMAGIAQAAEHLLAERLGRRKFEPSFPPPNQLSCRRQFRQTSKPTMNLETAHCLRRLVKKGSISGTEDSLSGVREETRHFGRQLISWTKGRAAAPCFFLPLESQ